MAPRLEVKSRRLLTAFQPISTGWTRSLSTGSGSTNSSFIATSSDSRTWTLDRPSSHPRAWDTFAPTRCGFSRVDSKSADRTHTDEFYEVSPVDRRGP